MKRLLRDREYILGTGNNARATSPLPSCFEKASVEEMSKKTTLFRGRGKENLEKDLSSVLTKALSSPFSD